MARTNKASADMTLEKASEGICISIEDAEQIYSLFQNVEVADAHFFTCQAVDFRQHVQSVYKAENVRKAFEGLNAAINMAKGG